MNQKRRKMMTKKRTLIMLSILLILGLLMSAFGCKVQPSTPSPAAPAASPAPAPATSPSPTLTPAPSPKPASPTPTSTPTTAPAPAQPKVVTWKLHTHNLRDASTTGRMDYIASTIEKYTEGRIKIEQYYQGELVPPGELFDAAGKGIVQLVFCTPAYLAGKMPGLADVESGLPRGFRSMLEMMDCFWNYGLTALCQQEYAKFNVRFYTPVNANSGVGLWSKVPVNTVKDLKGLKIRSVGAQGKLLEKMGASVVYLPGPEIYMALKLGTVQAATWGNYAFDESNKYHEVTEYFLAEPLSGTSEENVYGSLAAYNELSDRDKFLVTEAIKSAAFMSWAICNKADKEARQRIMAKKPTFTELRWTDAETIAAMDKAAAEVRADAAKASAAGAQAVKILEDYLKLQGHMK